jgi:hypothetical protein
VRRYGGIAAVLVLVGAAASPASASVTTAGGYKYVSRAFQFGDDYYGDLEAKCPQGTHVLGGGESNDAPASQLIAHDSAPLDTGDQGNTTDDGWRVGLDSKGHYTVTVSAICGTRQVSYVRDHFSADPNGTTERALACPDGTSPMSGGTTGPQKTRETETFPGSGSWAVSVVSTASADNTVKDYAVCAHFSATATGHTKMLGGMSGGTINVDCSSAGRYTVGGGTSTVGGPGGFAIRSLRPRDSHDGWRVAGFNSSTGDISVSSIAICAKPEN